jgi:hypothetical protein
MKGQAVAFGGVAETQVRFCMASSPVKRGKGTTRSVVEGARYSLVIAG